MLWLIFAFNIDEWRQIIDDSNLRKIKVNINEDMKRLHN